MFQKFQKTFKKYCNRHWDLNQPFGNNMKPARGPQTEFLAIIVVESQGLPTMKCQKKCAKAIFGSIFKHRDSRSARNGCHGAAGLGKSRQVQASGLATSNPEIQANGS